MAAKMQDIFGPGSNVQGRVFRSLDQLAPVIEACKLLELRVVLTSGTFDLLHVGHGRYLEQAKQRGDVLVVGVDSDGKVRKKKGPHRPVVHEDERMEIVCQNRSVDLVYLKQETDPKWHLIKAVRPDVLIATQETYGAGELEALKEYCGEVVVLESQATTSTTARVRSILIGPVEAVKERLRAAVEDVNAFLDNLTGGGT